jgi:hypothetical protein
MASKAERERLPIKKIDVSTLIYEWDGETPIKISVSDGKPELDKFGN